MTAVFLYGTLCHPPLLAEVLGRAAAPRPARATGEAAYWAAGQAFPILVPEAGAEVAGLLLETADAGDLDRLDFYEIGFGLGRIMVMPEGGQEPVEALVFRPSDTAGRWLTGARWRLEDWVPRWGEGAVDAARHLMARAHLPDRARFAARYPMLMVRSGARARARPGGPTSLRHRAGAQDIAVAALRHPYENYFAVEEYDISWRRFDGGMSAPQTRAAFVSGDAVVVLPYDPHRDRVLVIEQFRAGPYARGDSQPWLIEGVAGRIDGGETPEEAARREAVEEAGLRLERLLPGPNVYASPGMMTEYLYHYIGLADLPDSAARIGGLEEEGEDIRGHVLPFARLMELVESGEADNAPLVLLALWLERRRPAIRAEAGIAD